MERQNAANALFARQARRVSEDFEVGLPAQDLFYGAYATTHELETVG